ncbi:MAG: hypothetical protein JNM14_15495 [Ferruginibacter sp.]|nr:hypothetical protein [Ferruginibacter sp.]
MKALFLCILVILSSQIQAQNKIVFTKADSSSIVTIKQNGLVRLAYNGYLKQPQEAEGIVTAINDSTITLSPRKKLFRKSKPGQTFYIHDITGFRLYSKFRPAGEIIYGIVGVGITGTVTAIIGGVSIPAVLSFLSGGATLAVTTALKNVVLSSKIKNRLNNGWNMQLQPGP